MAKKPRFNLGAFDSLVKITSENINDKSKDPLAKKIEKVKVAKSRSKTAINPSKSKEKKTSIKSEKPDDAGHEKNKVDNQYVTIKYIKPGRILAMRSGRKGGLVDSNVVEIKLTNDILDKSLIDIHKNYKVHTSKKEPGLVLIVK